MALDPMHAAETSSPLPPRYRLFVFDLDGTLADSFPFFVASQRRLAALHGFRPIMEEDVETLRGWAPRQLMRHTRLPFWKLPRVAKDFRRLMEAEGHAIACFPGVHDALHHLHAAGVQLALVSSNSVQNCRRVLGPGTWGLLSHVECGASLFGKARRLKRTCRTLGHAPGDVIYVGDQTTDAEAARRAGVAFGAVAWGYATPESLARCAPDVFVEDVRALATLGTPPLAKPSHRQGR